MFFAATVRSLTAQARLDRERDNDIRAAVAGYEAGEVVPALAELIEEVERLRGDGETLVDTLNRADVDALFGAAVKASIRSQSPRDRERALVHRYTALGGFLLIAQLTAPVALYNVLTKGYNLPDTVVLAAAATFASTGIAALVAAILVAIGEIGLARSIRKGKDAA